MTEDAQGNAFPLALCPLAGTDTFQLMLPVPAGAELPEVTVPQLQRVLDAAAGPGRVRLTDLVWTSAFRANMRMAERFRVGRVFLAGDAAHVHSPAGGQGLNTSIQDVYNLGWKLAAVLAGAPVELLDSYEGERLPVAARVLGISTRLHDKGVAGDSDAHRRDDPELQQLNLGYPEGPLSFEERAAGAAAVGPGSEASAAAASEPASRLVRAGDRAPDVPMGESIRLFELFQGTHITLLALGAAAERAAVAVAQDAAEGALLVVGGGAAVRRGYGVAPDADVLLLVRPDGYLGLALDVGAERVEAAADRVRDYLLAVQPKS
ncbi:FAD-dependent monooxygenase [Streptacidiphilus sp. PAMC 29251]